MDFQFGPSSEEYENPEKNLSGIVHTPGVTDFSSPHSLGVEAPLKPDIEGGALAGLGAPKKPTLHVGEVSPHPNMSEALIGKTATGGKVEYLYHSSEFNFEPIAAHEYSKTDSFLGTHYPDAVEFPPAPISKPALPTLHIGEPEHVGEYTGSAKTADGGTIFYNYHPNDKPSYAELYDAKGNLENDELTPDTIAFPKFSSLKKTESALPEQVPFTPEKPTLHTGNLKPAGSTLMLGKTSSGNDIAYAYKDDLSPDYAETYDLNNNVLSFHTPDQINFPKHSLEQVPWAPEKPTIAISTGKIEWGPDANSQEAHAHAIVKGETGHIYYDYVNGKPSKAEFFDSTGDSKYKFTPNEIEFPLHPSKPTLPQKDEPYPKLEPTEPFTEQEKRKIYEYTGSHYGNLSDHVYHGGTNPELDEHIDIIDHAIAKHPLPTAMTLHRGVSDDVFNKFAKLAVGESGVQTGFFSASTKPDFAENWKSGKTFVVTVPAGTKGLPVDSISANSGEKEILFQTGTHVKVLKKEKNTLYVEILPSASRAKWIEPSESNMQQEYDVEYQRHFKTDTIDPFQSAYDFKDAVKEAPVVRITKEEDRTIQNRSHSRDMKELLSLIKGYASYPQYRNENTLFGLKNRIDNGSSVHMPIVIKFPDGKMRILSGNTRLDINFMKHNEADVKMIDLSKYQSAPNE